MFLNLDLASLCQIKGGHCWQFPMSGILTAKIMLKLNETFRKRSLRLKYRFFFDNPEAEPPDESSDVGSCSSVCCSQFAVLNCK